MSAFMCSADTLYLISDYLFTLRHLEGLKQIGVINKDPLSVTRLDVFDILYKMNKDALIARYGEGAVSELVEYAALDGFVQARRKYGEKEELVPDIVLFYKINCFLYQCAEGDVDKHPLYNFLKGAYAHLAVDIVRSSKEYQEVSIDEWN